MSTSKQPFHVFASRPSPGPTGPGSVRPVRRRTRLLLPVVMTLAWGFWSACDAPPPVPPPDSSAVYEERPPGSPAGTGRFYMGREIAAATDHGPAWLDRPEREVREFPDRVVEALDLRPNDVVADIGAGTGYFTFRLSPRVPAGRVLAVDIQDEMLAHIRTRIRADTVANVQPILGSTQDPNLPADSVDVALIVVSYHEFSHPREMMQHIVRALRPGGRVVLVEYRGEDPTLPVDPVHTMTQEQVRREMEAVGLVWTGTKDVLPQQHLMTFEKPTGRVP